MSQVKQQHYIPRFYLDGFTDNSGNLYALRREAFGKPSSIYCSSPRKMCKEKNLYEVRSKDGYVEQNYIEDHFGRIESYVSPFVKRLYEIDLCASDDLPDDAVTMLDALAIFAANLIVRHPISIALSREGVPECFTFLNESNFFKDTDLAKLDELGYGADLEAIVELGALNASAAMYIEGSPMQLLSELFNGMDVMLLKAPLGAMFITASFPFVLEWDNQDDAYPSTVYLPLCKHTAVIFHKSCQSRTFFCRHCSVHNVISLNQALIMRNEHWNTLLSPKREVLLALSRACLRSGYSARSL